MQFFDLPEHSDDQQKDVLNKRNFISMVFVCSYALTSFGTPSDKSLVRPKYVGNTTMDIFREIQTNASSWFADM